ncbi:MAG TPA: YhjD/YihY/BrkB family envelope integrity protein [Planctomycetota bacterium]|nr:YhjD/YihY/BrkB family envelope integrity protein [Planctomycetota bacterium]
MAKNAASEPAAAATDPAKKPRRKMGDLAFHFHRLLNADLGDSPSRSVEMLSYLIRLTRETVHELGRARCFLRASALAYSTILSLVPLLALLMALLSMPALASHQERVINRIAEGLTPGIDESHFWGEKGIKRYVRVTIKDANGATEEIVGEQIGQKGFPNYPEGSQPIMIKRQIPLNETPKDEPAVLAGVTIPPEQFHDRRTYYWVPVDQLQAVYADAEADGRIREVGLADQGDRKATLYAYLGNFTSKAGAVGMIGFVLLLYIVYSMLNRIESTFADIWGISKKRSLFQRVSLYTSLIFWGPIVMIAANAGLEFLTHLQLAYLPAFTVRLVGVLVTAVALTGAYIILPNTTVKFRAAMTGGVFAAILWVLATYGFSSYIAMTGGGSYQRIYGTLGLLPMILIMIYMSWVILLSGAVVSFTVQNFADLDNKYLMQHRAEDSQVYMALRLCVEVVREFRTAPPAGEAPLPAAGGGTVGSARMAAASALAKLSKRKHKHPTLVVAEEIDVPPYAVAAIGEKLVAAGILIEASHGRGSGLMPAREPDLIPVHEIITAVRPHVMAVPQKSRHPERDAVGRVIKDLGKAEEASLEGLTIGQLTRRLDAARSAESSAQAKAVEDAHAPAGVH